MIAAYFDWATSLGPGWDFIAILYAFAFVTMVAPCFALMALAKLVTWIERKWLARRF